MFSDNAHINIFILRVCYYLINIGAGIYIRICQKKYRGFVGGDSIFANTAYLLTLTVWQEITSMHAIWWSKISIIYSILNTSSHYIITNNVGAELCIYSTLNISDHIQLHIIVLVIKNNLLENLSSNLCVSYSRAYVND